MRATLLVLTLAAGLSIPGAEAQAQAAANTLVPDCSSYPCGRVESIRRTTVKQAWTPLGAGVGGYGGGPTGGDPGAVTSTFKIGPGPSDPGVVPLGAAGGARYMKAPNSYEQPQWEVKVKLDSGRSRTVLMRFEPHVREGDRVRVVGANVERLS